MAGRDRRPFSEEPVTVWPRASADESPALSHESGLSVEPEDLGAQFLCSATEAEDTRELSSPFGDDDSSLADDFDEAAFQQAAFEEDPWGWERAITRSLRAVGLQAQPSRREAARGRSNRLPPEQPSRERDEIDLTEESIRDASLLDHESEEYGEVESPRIRTDDGHTHARPRGGHLPSRSTRRPRPK